MPGAAILERLEPIGYDSFFKLASRYVEEMLNSLVSIHLGCDLVDMHLKRLGYAMFTEAAYKDALQEAAEDNALFAENIMQDVRHFFWYDPASPNEDHITGYENTRNRAEWSPYDGAAWDQFMSRVLAHFAGQIRELEIRLKSMNTIESLDQYSLDAEKAAKIKGIKRRLVDEALHRLHMLLNAELYEAHMQSLATR
jgi:hypothetical protein